jgi:hypothetical protein
VSCVPNVASFSRLSIVLIVPSVYSNVYLWRKYFYFSKEFEDIKSVIRIRKSKKNRQCNGQNKTWAHLQTTRGKDKYGKNTLKFTQKTVFISVGRWSNTYCVVFFYFVCLRLVSCVPNVASFSRLSIVLIVPSVLQ